MIKSFILKNTVFRKKLKLLKSKQALYKNKTNIDETTMETTSMGGKFLSGSNLEH